MYPEVKEKGKREDGEGSMAGCLQPVGKDITFSNELNDEIRK